MDDPYGPANGLADPLRGPYDAANGLADAAESPSGAGAAEGTDDAGAALEPAAAAPARRARPWESEEAAFALLVRVVIGAITLIVIVKGVEALI